MNEEQEAEAARIVALRARIKKEQLQKADKAAKAALAAARRKEVAAAKAAAREAGK